MWTILTLIVVGYFAWQIDENPNRVRLNKLKAERDKHKRPRPI